MLRTSTRLSDRLLGLLCAFAGLLVAATPAGAQLLVVSQADARVLEYDAGDGSFVAPFVVPVSQGFAFPGGIALRPGQGDLYVSSTSSGEIWIYDFATGVAQPPPAATALQAPGALVFDAGGANLYFIADVENGQETDAALWRLAVPGGGVTQLASDAAASFSSLALEGSSLYVSDSFGGKVVRYPVSGGAGTTLLSGLASPAGILLLSPTQMLIAETSADRVSEYQESGGSWTFVRYVLTPSAGVDGPYGLALAPDGRLSVSGAYSNQVVAVDLGTLAATTLVAPGSGLLAPGALTWHGNTLLVASRAGNTVNYFDANGAPTGTLARGLTSPADAGMARTGSGNVLVASASANDVIEYDGSSGAIVRRLPNACPLSFTQPFDVVTDAAGDVYVTCPPTDGVRRFDATGSSLSFVTAGAGGLGSPRSLAFAPSGNLLVSSVTGEVLEYAAGSGSFVGVFVDAGGNGGGPVDPYGLAFHQSSLFVASFFPSEVRQFDASSGAFVQTFVTSGSGGLSGPSSLAFGPDGSLYVTSQGDDSVKRYDGATGSFVDSFVAPSAGGLDAPFDLLFLVAPGAPAVGALSWLARLGLVAGLALAGAGRVARPRTAARPRRSGRAR